MSSKNLIKIGRSEFTNCFKLFVICEDTVDYGKFKEVVGNSIEPVRITHYSNYKKLLTHRYVVKKNESDLILVFVDVENWTNACLIYNKIPNSVWIELDFGTQLLRKMKDNPHFSINVEDKKMIFSDYLQNSKVYYMGKSARASFIKMKISENGGSVTNKLYEADKILMLSADNNCVAMLEQKRLHPEKFMQQGWLDTNGGKDKSVILQSIVNPEPLLLKGFICSIRKGIIIPDNIIQSLEGMGLVFKESCQPGGILIVNEDDDSLKHNTEFVYAREKNMILIKKEWLYKVGTTGTIETPISLGQVNIRLKLTAKMTTLQHFRICIHRELADDKQVMMARIISALKGKIISEYDLADIIVTSAVTTLDKDTTKPDIVSWKCLFDHFHMKHSLTCPPHHAGLNQVSLSNFKEKIKDASLIVCSSKNKERDSPCLSFCEDALQNMNISCTREVSVINAAENDSQDRIFVIDDDLETKCSIKEQLIKEEVDQRYIFVATDFIRMMEDESKTQRIIGLVPLPSQLLEINKSKTILTGEIEAKTNDLKENETTTKKKGKCNMKSNRIQNKSQLVQNIRAAIMVPLKVLGIRSRNDARVVAKSYAERLPFILDDNHIEYESQSQIILTVSFENSEKIMPLRVVNDLCRVLNITPVMHKPSARSFTTFATTNNGFTTAIMEFKENRLSVYSIIAECFLWRTYYPLALLNTCAILVCSSCDILCWKDFIDQICVKYVSFIMVHEENPKLISAIKLTLDKGYDGRILQKIQGVNETSLVELQDIVLSKIMNKYNDKSNQKTPTPTIYCESCRVTEVINDDSMCVRVSKIIQGDDGLKCSICQNELAMYVQEETINI